MSVVTAGICYRPPEQREADEAFLQKMEESASSSFPSWSTLTSLISAGKTRQQGSNNQSNFWSVHRTRDPTSKAALLEMLGAEIFSIGKRRFWGESH